MRVHLSIVITTFNRERFLRELLNGLAMEGLQRNGSIEIVVGDNASTDETPQVIQEFISILPEMRFFRNEYNVGFSGNLKKGISAAKGEYVWSLCDDDLIYPGTVSRIIGLLDRYRGVPLILLNRDIYDAGMQKVTCFDAIGCKDVRLVDSYRMVRDFGDSLLSASSVIVRRDLAVLGAERREYEGNWCETLVIACAALSVGNGVVAGDMAIKYRGGNTGSWNIRWPVINVYNIPFVISRSEVASRAPDLTKQFLRRRKINLAYSLCYIGGIKNVSIRRSVDLPVLRGLYRGIPGFRTWYFIAFQAPPVIPRAFVLFCSVVAELREEIRRNGVRPTGLVRHLLRKYRNLRRKETCAV